MADNIDQDLYSRQLYVIGNQAMVKLVKSNVLLHGLGGLGIEIAKNLVLAGVGSLTITDDQVCTLDDVGCQFYINQGHVDHKVTRAEASLEQLKNLNPYVKLSVVKQSPLTSGDPEKVKELVGQFDIVVVTELCSMSSLVQLNKTCRASKVKFLFGDVHGLFGWCFNDFSEGFEVSDHDGEEYESHFVSRIANDAEPLVEIVEGKSHNLQDGDTIKFSEVNGMCELNDQSARVKVVNSKKFTLVNVDTTSFGPYTNGGVFKRLKTPKIVDFKPLDEQLVKPDLVVSDLDESAYLNPYLTHVGLLALYEYREAASGQGFEPYFGLVKEKFANFRVVNPGAVGLDQVELDDAASTRFFKSLFFTSRAKLPTLCAFFGGLMAQEVIKSITNKFTPLTQWLHLEVSSLFEPSNDDSIESVYARLEAEPARDRYSVLRQCFGGDLTLSRLKRTKLFMVGCGAIGCEMLKNYAMLGVGTDDKQTGLISVTDNDLIEKSNLNRQFLFRKEDIQKSKSLVAASAVAKINAQVNIRPYDKKLCSQTEAELFSDAFFGLNDVCVNALDNVEARRYMDARCVSNQKPLIESGTLGPKGHVQVILPFLTESYTSQQDPQAEHGSDVPYCTLKSFPANIEHCIEWARDKFESSFHIKPNHLAKFFAKYTISQLTELIAELRSTNAEANIDGLTQACKSLRSACQTYEDCLVLARNKFEKYFAHKAKDLLHLYPASHLMSDGTPFWKLPRRQPKPVEFDDSDPLHLGFVTSCAKLYASVYGIEAVEDNAEYVRTKLNSNRSRVVEWRPNSSKHIETDESKKKDTAAGDPVTTQQQSTKNKDLTNAQCAELIENLLLAGQNKSLSEVLKAKPLFFEKDDDSNGHIDYMTATANLRATMYAIEPSDRLHIKRIAGRIVPAIATTTSCISALATIELIKVVQELARVDETSSSSAYARFNLAKFRNYFINLAISLYVFSEPGRCAKQKIVDNVFVTLWDKWTIDGAPDFTLKNFVDAVKLKYKLTVSGVIYGTKPIYMPVMPGHAKRLGEKMAKLVKGLAKLEANEETRKMYADLFLTYAECDDDDDNTNRNSICPPIRYFFNRK